MDRRLIVGTILSVTLGCSSTPPPVPETICEGGRFAIAMPGAVWEESKELKDHKDRPYRLYKVSATVGTATYMTLSSRYVLRGEKVYDEQIEKIFRRRRENPEEYLDLIEADLKRDGHAIFHKAAVTVRGHKGRDFEYRSAAGLANRYRVVLANGYLYQIYVDGTAADLVSEDAERYFASFKVLD